LHAELIYDLCAALVRAGIAKPEEWEACGADALSFAKHAVMKAIGVKRGELLRRNVEFQMEIADAYPDGYLYDQDSRLHGAFAVCMSCTGAGVFRVGK
jgi:hypothetical protein